MTALKGITLRVYGIYLDASNRLLVTDEFRMGQRMTKLPGGGHQLGEGLEDCLLRECREELGANVRIQEHFYTTGFFQATWLLPEPRQIISIYYRIDIPEPYPFRLTEIPFDYGDEVEGAQCFRLVGLIDIKEDELYFPIDRHVLSMLKNLFL